VIAALVIAALVIAALVIAALVIAVRWLSGLLSISKIVR
jgi:hypothetical protein